MKSKYSQNWRDYILVSIIVGGIFGMCFFLFFPGFTLSFEMIIIGFLIGTVICSPFILLIGFPTLMYAQKFDNWKKWAIVSFVGFFSSNVILILFAFVATIFFSGKLEID